MKRTLLGGLLLLLLLPAPGIAAGVGLNEVVRALESPFKPGAPNAVRDVRADFFQESHIASLDRTQRGRGTVMFKFEPGVAGHAPVAMFNWQYEEPSRQQIVSDGRTMSVYLPESNQVIESDISSIEQANATNPITFLSGLGNLSRDFTIRWAEPNQDAKGNYVVTLRPLRSSTLVREMVLVVDREAAQAQAQAGGPREAFFPILSSTVVDPTDNRTIIEFSAIQVNRGFSALDFRFVMPPGVDVVRPSGAGMGY